MNRRCRRASRDRRDGTCPVSALQQVIVRKEAGEFARIPVEQYATRRIKSKYFFSCGQCVLAEDVQLGTRVLRGCDTHGKRMNKDQRPVDTRDTVSRGFRLAPIF
jgi:hypothetical protein